MRKIFWRFYLTVVVFFLASALVIGSIYKHILTQSIQHYLADIFKTTLYLIEDELIDVPQALWPKEITQLQDKVPVHVKVDALDAYVLTPANQRTLFKGNIIRLEDSGLFLQRIPGSEYMLVLGPIDYLNSLSSLQWVDYLMLLTLCISLAISAFFWLRPVWRQLHAFSLVSKSLGTGNFAARVSLPSASPLNELANTFNSMAHNIQQLMDDRKLMIDAVSHDLRTPIARLRYRIEALRLQLPIENRETLLTPMSKDLDCLGEMTDELLLFSRLDCPTVQIEKQAIVLIEWLVTLLAEFEWQGTSPVILNNTKEEAPVVYADPYYLHRALTNLLTNACRYKRQQIQIMLEKEKDLILIHIDDDGPGVPEPERDNILKPFIRLDHSRNAQTGGYGMGLAIVQKILYWHQGKVLISQSELGGARVTIAWPSAKHSHI
jgi:two-component system sensor histidine kinase RstB